MIPMAIIAAVGSRASSNANTSNSNSSRGKSKRVPVIAAVAPTAALAIGVFDKPSSLKRPSDRDNKDRDLPAMKKRSFQHTATSTATTAVRFVPKSSSSRDIYAQNRQSGVSGDSDQSAYKRSSQHTAAVTDIATAAKTDVSSSSSNGSTGRFSSYTIYQEPSAAVVMHDRINGDRYDMNIRHAWRMQLVLKAMAARLQLPRDQLRLHVHGRQIDCNSPVTCGELMLKDGDELECSMVNANFGPIDSVC